MGRLMGSGLDKKQLMMKIESETKIYNYIQKNEPVLFSQIVHEAGLSDKQIIRRRLSDIIKMKKVSSIKLFYTVDKNKGREYYYSEPVSSKIKFLLLRESYLREVNNTYQNGFLDTFPIFLQFEYKIKFLWSEFDKLEEQFQKKPSVDYESITHFKQYALQSFSDLEQVSNSIVSDPDSYFMLKDWYDNVIQQCIQIMDILYTTYKKLRGRGMAIGVNKIIIANILIENTKRGTMKKLGLGLSSKLGSKLEKELFDVNGSPKINVINKILEDSFGKMKYDSLILSGKTLMDKWNDLQK